MAAIPMKFSVDSYAGFALGDNRVWVNPAADLSTVPEYLLHEILHCALEQLKYEGKLIFADVDEEYIVETISKSGVRGLKYFFCKPKLRKGMLKRIQAARERLATKEEWK